MKKTLTMVLAFALVFALGVGGTLAWLTSETTAVENVFTVGDINIELDEEHGPNYDFVPGDTITKDPVVTVKADSEACYLFIKVTDNEFNVDPNSADDVTEKIINWTVKSDWTQYVDNNGNAVAGVYYKTVNATTEDVEFEVFVDNQVTVSTAVTKAMVNDLKTNKPTVTIDAAAVQSDNIANVQAAYAEVQWN